MELVRDRVSKRGESERQETVSSQLVGLLRKPQTHQRRCEEAKAAGAVLILEDALRHAVPIALIAGKHAQLAALPDQAAGVVLEAVVNELAKRQGSLEGVEHLAPRCSPRDGVTREPVHRPDRPGQEAVVAGAEREYCKSRQHLVHEPLGGRLQAKRIARTGWQDERFEPLRQKTG